jgi:hypothetical protein
MAWIPGSTMMGSGIQVILKLLPNYLNNFKGFSVGVTDRGVMNLRCSDSLRRHDMHTKFHEDRLRLPKSC